MENDGYVTNKMKIEETKTKSVEGFPRRESNPDPKDFLGK
jgi:hypothetical protein